MRRREEESGGRGSLGRVVALLRVVACLSFFVGGVFRPLMGQNVDQLYTQAGVHMQAGRFQDAVAIFQQVAQLRPGDANPLVGWGYALIQLGRSQDALGILGRALSLDPNSSDAFTNLGFAHWTLGNREEAVAAYTRAVQANPSNAQAFYNLGNSYQVMGSPGLAIPPLEQALRLRPDHVDAWVTLGSARLSLGDSSGAIEPLRRALSLASDRPDARFNLGLALGRAGDMEGAAREFGWLEENDPGLASRLHGQLGDAVVRARRIQEATPRPDPVSPADNDPSVTLLGRSAGEGRSQGIEPGAEDAIVGSWHGEFSSEGGRHQLGEGVLTITKTGPGVYQLQVTSGWVKTGYREDAPYFTGCMLRAETSRDMVYGFPMYVYRGESGAYFSDGTPKPVTIRLTPGAHGAPPDVQISIAEARNTGFRSLTKVPAR